MKLIFKEISIRNFLSFGNIPQVINLNSKNFQIITGQNKDKSDNEEDRNGVGKSTIQQAIHYCLFGKSTGNTANLSWLVNNINGKNMVVSLKFEKDGVDYEIIRGRSPAILKLIKNGEDAIVDEAQGDSRETQKEIEKIIGFDDDLYNQLFNLTCIVPMFLKQTSPNQKSILERILGVDTISNKIVSLKDVIKETKNELNNETFKYNTVKSQNEMLLASIEKQVSDMTIAKNQWKQSIETNIKTTTHQIDEMNLVNIDQEMINFKLLAEYENLLGVNLQNQQLKASLEKANLDIQNRMTPVCQRLDTLLKTDFEKEKNAIEYNDSLKLDKIKYVSELDKHNENLKKYDAEQKRFKTISESIKSKQNQLDNVNPDVCPVCGGVLDKAHLDAWKSSIENDIKSLQEDSHKCDMEIMELNSLISNFVPKTFDEKPSKFKTMLELMSEQSEINVLKDSLLRDEKTIEENLKKINELEIKELGEKPSTHYKTLEEAMGHKARLEALQTNLKQYQESLDSNPFEQQEKSIEEMKLNMVSLDDSKIKELEEELLHQETLLKLLNSPSSFIRKTILDKSLDYLNGRIKQYLTSMGSMHSISFNNDMSIKISKMGVDYGYISSGEEGRVAMALTFAFRDVWESLNNCYVNFWFFDEIVDRLGLDEAGVDLLVKMIRSKDDKNIFMVTHNSKLISQTNDVIKLVKECDFTKIVE